MRGVDGLIRLWKWRLDERRRIVVDLEILRGNIERQMEKLDQELERERKIATRNYEAGTGRSEEHTSELQSLMRISYAVFCLKKKTQKITKVYHKNTLQE